MMVMVSAIRLIETLSDLGFPKVTCEGGPGLLSQLLTAELVDEYDLTISPVVAGLSKAHCRMYCLMI